MCGSVSDLPEAIQLKSWGYTKGINYMHMNPVRAGLVEKAIDYRWSSARIWHGHADENEPLIVDLDGSGGGGRSPRKNLGVELPVGRRHYRTSGGGAANASTIKLEPEANQSGGQT